jgi:hypothetical protein
MAKEAQAEAVFDPDLAPVLNQVQVAAVGHKGFDVFVSLPQSSQWACLQYVLPASAAFLYQLAAWVLSRGKPPPTGRE